MPQGKVFLQDDDCHWYLIPTEMRMLFWQLEDNGEIDGYASFNGKFEEYRINHPSEYVVEIAEGV